MEIRRGEKKGQGLKIGVVTSLFNREVTQRLEQGALEALKAHGVKESDIIATQVPGAFEIPVVAKALFQNNSLDGIVALGAVIRGETTHYDYVCRAVERGCSQVALEFGKPVGFGVLTTENEEQAFSRTGGPMGHKGQEAAEVVLEICNLIRSLQNKS